MSECVNGCHGCVDSAGYHEGSNVSCEYQRNHGHVRPVPALEGGGCAIYAKTYEEQARLEREHRWDRKKASRLRRKGYEHKEIAKQVGASINALTVYFNGCDVPEPDPVPLREGAKWDREEEYMKLYNAGVNDRGAAFAMGLSVQTIGNRRRQLGLPRVARRKKRGA